MGPIPGGTQYPPGPAGVFLTRPHKRYGNLPGGPCAKRCARLARLGLDAHLLEYTAVLPKPANPFFQDMFKVRLVFYISPPKHQRSWGQVIERTRCCHMCIYEGSVYIYIYIYVPQSDLSVGVLTVLVRGLDVYGAPSTAAAHHFSLYFTLLGDLTLKNTM